MYFTRMISNELNLLDGKDGIANHLKRLGNRIKTLRIKAGYMNYEKFAFKHDISRAQFRRYELGQDLRVSTLLTEIKALDMTIAEFFSDGFE